MSTTEIDEPLQLYGKRCFRFYGLKWQFHLSLLISHHTVPDISGTVVETIQPRLYRETGCLGPGFPSFRYLVLMDEADVEEESSRLWEQCKLASNSSTIELMTRLRRANLKEITHNEMELYDAYLAAKTDQP
jgi:hypothetical protein